MGPNGSGKSTLSYVLAGWRGGPLRMVEHPMTQQTAISESGTSKEGVQTFPAMDVVRTVIRGEEIFFCVDMERDPVQRNHRKGQFYEARELQAIRKNFPAGGVFVDIGANVGNHSLFVAKFLEPSRIIPFEPNHRAYRLLMANVTLNRVAELFDLSHLGIGLSDRRLGGYAMEHRERNLGAARMIEGSGDLEVHAGDMVLDGVNPAFVKIDVEGMEMQVLHGLSETLARVRPALLVEVDEANDAAFHGWSTDAGYRVEQTFTHYKTNKNYLMKAV